MEILIMSCYFTENTRLITSFCSKCYRNSYKNHKVLIKALNLTFLKHHDRENYQKVLKLLAGKINIIEKDGGKWVAPISPHNLIEEKYYNDPWAILIVTIFLNKTSSKLALPQINIFFENFKGPYDVIKSCRSPADLEPYFEKIGKSSWRIFIFLNKMFEGLTRTRARNAWKMSHDYVEKNWNSVRELFGVGKYGEDAYRMFHLGDFNVEPEDRFLKIYKEWYLRRSSTS